MKFFRRIFLFFITFTIFGFANSALATTQLNVSVVNNDLRINSCSTNLLSFMGYKGYVDSTQVFTTGSGGGFPCYSGDLFFPNLSGFLASYFPGPFHFTFDFYSSIDFNPPVYAHFNLYYNGTSWSTFNDTTHIVSFTVSTSTRVATVHNYIASSDVGAGINFNIGSTTPGNTYTATTVYSTTTGDFYNSFTYPELTTGSDYTFYTDIATSSVITSTSTVINIPTPTPTYSNVLFLPGIESSRLYEDRGPTCNSDCEDQLWEPGSDSDAEALFINPDGTSLNDVYTRDVLDEAYVSLVGPNIYKSFLQKLEEMKSTDHTIADYSAVPYDWRFSLEDIVNRGVKTGNNVSYLHDTSDPYIISELRRLATNSNNGKVTIIAHSNGGLVAKALLKKLADTNDPLLQKIDKVIFVAVPQLGTPSAITAMLHGYDQEISIPLIYKFLSERMARELGQNLPGAYTLLPSANYFTYVDTPVVTFDTATTAEWISRYGETIHSQDRLHNFLTDTYGRVDGGSAETDTPDSLRDNLLSSAESEHTLLDNWTPPSGVEVVDIAGWGIPTTVSGVKYSMKGGKIKIQPTWTIDGDGVVVTPSALWTNGNASTTRYWVDLDAYNIFLIRHSDHKDILEVPQVIDFIKDNLIIASTTALETYISTSTPTSQSNTPRLIYSLHSPLTLNIYDSLGNHTGISTTSGQIEEQIPGTYFIQFGDVKYIFTGTDTPIHINMTGYDIGTFTFTIEQKQGDNSVSTVTFQDIPTSPSTNVTMSVSGDINTLSSLNIDSDNNGSSDITLAPIIDGTVTYTPPTPVSTTVPAGGNGPVIQNMPTPIATSSPEIASTTPETIASTTPPVVVFQVKPKENKVVKNISKVIPKVQKITEQVVVTETNNINQLAQVSSLNLNYVSKFTNKMINLLKKTVNWSLSIFR